MGPFTETASGTDITDTAQYYKYCYITLTRGRREDRVDMTARFGRNARKPLYTIYPPTVHNMYRR